MNTTATVLLNSIGDQTPPGFGLRPVLRRFGGTEHWNKTPLSGGAIASQSGAAAHAVQDAGAWFRALALSLAVLAVTIPSLPAADFVDLFNGRDLAGWVNVNCAPETWSVKDGVIHCTGVPTGALRTPKQYENFELELEWRHLKPGGNAGIFIWSSPIAAPGVPFLRAIEVQVLDHGYNANGKNEWYTTHGDVFPIHGSTMKPFGRHNGQRSFPSEQRSKPSPEWNQYRIVATNGVLRLSVNGKEVSGGENCNWRKGYIGLESEGSPVEFRNIRLKEFPSTNAGSEASAPPEEGFLPLYNGLDLRGWKATDEIKSRWQPSDWQLVLKDNAAKPGSILWSEQAFRDFEFIVDFKLPEKADTEQVCGGFEVGGYRVILSENQFPGRLKTGKWQRLRIQAKQSKRNIQLDGELAAEVDIAGTAGSQPRSIGVLDTGRGIEFANFYLRK